MYLVYVINQIYQLFNKSKTVFFLLYFGVTHVQFIYVFLIENILKIYICNTENVKVMHC